MTSIIEKYRYPDTFPWNPETALAIACYVKLRQFLLNFEKNRLDEDRFGLLPAMFLGKDIPFFDAQAIPFWSGLPGSVPDKRVTAEFVNTFPSSVYASMFAAKRGSAVDAGAPLEGSFGSVQILDLSPFQQKYPEFFQRRWTGLPLKIASKTLSASHGRTDEEKYLNQWESFEAEARSQVVLNKPGKPIQAFVRCIGVNPIRRQIFYEAGACDLRVLRQLMMISRSRTAVPTAALLKYVRQIFGALKEIGALGYVHFDIKPANVIAFSAGNEDVRNNEAAKQRAPALLNTGKLDFKIADATLVKNDDRPGVNSPYWGIAEFWNERMFSLQLLTAKEEFDWYTGLSQAINHTRAYIDLAGAALIIIDFMHMERPFAYAYNDEMKLLQRPLSSRDDFMRVIAARTAYLDGARAQIGEDPERLSLFNWLRRFCDFDRTKLQPTQLPWVLSATSPWDDRVYTDLVMQAGLASAGTAVARNDIPGGVQAFEHPRGSAVARAERAEEVRVPWLDLNSMERAFFRLGPRTTLKEVRDAISGGNLAGGTRLFFVDRKGEVEVDLFSDAFAEPGAIYKYLSQSDAWQSDILLERIEARDPRLVFVDENRLSEARTVDTAAVIMKRPNLIEGDKRELEQLLLDDLASLIAALEFAMARIGQKVQVLAALAVKLEFVAWVDRRRLQDWNELIKVDIERRLGHLKEFIRKRALDHRLTLKTSERFREIVSTMRLKLEIFETSLHKG